MLGSGLFSKKKAQKAHLVTGSGGLSGEIVDLRNDISVAFGHLAAITVEEFTNLPASDDDAIKASVASSGSDQTYSGSALDGVVGGGVMSPPRNIIITTTSHANIDAVGVVVTGEDVDGKTMTETITLTDGGNAVDQGNKAFAKVKSIFVPAQGGTGGAMKFGFGNKVGLRKTVKARAGLVSLTREIVGGRLLEAVVYEQLDNVAAADADAIKTSIATAATDQTYSGAALDGIIGGGVISPPRNITVTSSTHADVDAVAVVVTGEDIYGNVITDTITLTDGGNATDAGDVPFAKVTSIFVPANGGTGGALQFGTGLLVGFASPVKFRNADPVVLAENEAGTVKGYDALAGTYVAPGTNGSINGHVTFGSAPNGSQDYAYAYEPVRGVVVSSAVGAPHGTYTPPVAPGGGMDVAVYYESDPTVDEKP